MWASPFEVALANLRQQITNAGVYTSQMEAYETLKRLTGCDFGYDDKLWEEWGFQHECFLNPPRFLKYLSNLRGELPPESPYYMSRAEAYEKLKVFSGEDFGLDSNRWEQWGREHGHIR